MRTLVLFSCSELGNYRRQCWAKVMVVPMLLIAIYALRALTINTQLNVSWAAPLFLGSAGLMAVCVGVIADDHESSKPIQFLGLLLTLCGLVSTLF